MGGPVFSRIQFKHFSERWRPLLRKYRIAEPLHLTDFYGSYGKYSGMRKELKIALFGDVAKLIFQHFHFSLSISVPQADFKALIPEKDIRKCVAGPMTFAFFAAVVANREMAIRHNMRKIDYLVDRGSKLYNEQFMDAHAAVVQEEISAGDSYTGALNFETDDNVPALQAADVIAGSARLNESKRLVEEFAPLKQLIDSQSHIRIRLGKEAVARLSAPIYHWIVKHGTPPSFRDIIRR